MGWPDSAVDLLGALFVTSSNPCLTHALAEAPVDALWSIEGCEDEQMDPDDAVKVLEGRPATRTHGHRREHRTTQRPASDRANVFPGDPRDPRDRRRLPALPGPAGESPGRSPGEPSAADIDYQDPRECQVSAPGPSAVALDWVIETPGQSRYTARAVSPPLVSSMVPSGFTDRRWSRYGTSSAQTGSGGRVSSQGWTTPDSTERT
ncbi:hypothetical protein E4K10_45065 [Streptomyces sp. T1317-0309]|nr:hypothetical protein E4K10_45065 [Streptomyces sp. T1317-0309]